MSNQISPSKKVFSVFAEGDNLGNQALVNSNSDALPLATETLETAPTTTLTPELSVSAICHVQKIAPTEFHVQWSNDSGPIQFCGHGALAVAAYLDGKELLDKEITLHFTSGTYRLIKRDELYWFSSHSTHNQQSTYSQATPDTSSAQPVINAEILESVNFLGETGYLLFRLHDDTDLKTILPDLAALKRTTSRALIITSAQPSDPEFDYSLRYFAPQYGVDEDPATGSANEIAAQFWFSRLSASRLRCHQCSAAGGVIYAQKENKQIWIGGKVREC